MEEVLAPTPQTTLLILLGASSWPYSPEFHNSQAFANAARRVKAYFLNPQPFGLPSENVLDLFDADKSDDELDVAMGQFLQQRLAAMKADGHPARDLLLYFIGHGGFVGRDSDFYLAIRRTRMDNPRASGLQMTSLAYTLTEQARHLRRIIILDCCFASAAFSAFQSDPAQVALEKTVNAFEVGQKAVGYPTKGTTLLCSSNHTSPSLILPDGSSTMFTKAFLDALVSGSPSQRDWLTLRDVKDRVADLLSEIRNAPKPTVHSPDQSDGDVADIPFFPNARTGAKRLMLSVETPAPPSSSQKGPGAQMPHQHSRFPPLAVPTVAPKADQPVSMKTPTTLRSLSSTTVPEESSALSASSVSHPTQKRSKRVLVIIVSLLLLALGGSLFYFWFLPRPPMQEVMFGFNAAHTHNNPNEHTLSSANISRLTPLWSFATGDAIRSSPAVAGGMVYVGSYDGRLYALDATCRSDCRPLWSFETGASVSSSPAVAGGMVYVGSLDHKLYAFDAVCRKDCQPLWSFATGNSIDSSPAVAGGIVYIGSWDKKLYAFDATCRSACQPLWSFATGDFITSSPAIAGGMVYVGSSDKKLYAFDMTCRKDCQPLWSFLTGDNVDSSPAIAGAMVYVGSFDKKLYAFDAACRSDCKPLWSFATEDGIRSSPAVAGGIVYVGSFDKKLYAFDANCRSACQPLWSFATGDKIRSSPVVAGGIVYVGSNDGKLYAFDASCRSACQPLWNFATGSYIESSPAVASGRVYVGSGDNKLYAFGNVM